MIHEQLLLRYHSGAIFIIIYPVLPWIGVILVGYAVGPFFCMASQVRQRMAVLVGGLFLLVFSLLRIWHGYGDHRQLHHLGTPSRTVVSFLDVEKYPLSLHFVLATFGVLLLIYALFDAVATRGWLPRLRGFLEVYGRVPFFLCSAPLPASHCSAAAECSRAPQLALLHPASNALHLYGGLRSQPSAGLLCMAWRHSGFIPAMPVVWPAEGSAARLVAELPLAHVTGVRVDGTRAWSSSVAMCGRPASGESSWAGGGSGGP
jgi:hypothetical protein